jgi:hypothetical protein
LQLFDAVKLDESKWNTKGRNIILNIIKADPTAEYWPRLTKDKIKNAHIQADWAKWVDEDEEEEAKPVGEEWNEDNMNNTLTVLSMYLVHYVLLPKTPKPHL